MINYTFAIKMEKSTFPKFNLIVIVFLNLLPLIFYKYSSFLNITEHGLILPLAISFFTFQQIAFQTDIYTKKIKTTSFKDYLFFVLFFPQLVAGPIIHYKELIPQIKKKSWGMYKEEYFNMGILLFSIGMFKKVAFADNLSPIANQAFNHIDTLSNYDAWQGVMAYTFQIYFDFSGYSDMAIGLALFFGVRLPINFNSPYKATNLIEFWRSWHITLSNFLKEHIYIPLGGGRVESSRIAFNLMITMLLGGIWHGAGWNFLIWGGVHGLILILLHLIRKKISLSFPKIVSISITFLSISLLWVLFRSNSLNEAILYYQILSDFKFIYPLDIGIDQFILIISILIVWFLPNSMEISHYLKPRPNLKWYHAIFASMIFFISLKVIASSPAQNFVYFNF
jgi:D-alanyl-lipoteichoic acid acyltransferase DltB (MBOAT superfamily)